jgi:hypothetical protein
MQTEILKNERLIRIVDAERKVCLKLEICRAEFYINIRHTEEFKKCLRHFPKRMRPKVYLKDLEQLIEDFKNGKIEFHLEN